MKRRGFTLIELVVVMAIVAILSVIIVGAILAARNAATQTQRTGAVRTIETALESRAAKCNGMYFKASNNCGTPLNVTGGNNVDTISAVAAALRSANFLSANIEIDNDDRFSVVIDVANNTYSIKALANPGAGQGAHQGDQLYEAAR